MGKLYRTAQGRTVDLEELIQANEHKVAAGNAGLNARGDQLNRGGEVASRLADRARNLAQSRAQRPTSLKPPVTTEEVESVISPVDKAKQPARAVEPVETIDEDGNIIVEKPSRRPRKKSQDEDSSE